jgi:O-antigen ligase
MERDLRTLRESGRIFQHGSGTASEQDHAGWSAGSIILFLIFGYFWISLIPFATPGGAEQEAPASGSLLNQIVVVLLFAAAVTKIWQAQNRSAFLIPHPLLVLILCWFSFVSIFTPDPATAFRRIVYAVLVVGCGSAALLLPRNSEDFARVFATGVSAVLLLCYFAVVAMPNVGIHGSGEVEAALAGDWRGIFGHKNAAAAAMAYLVMFGLYLRHASYPKLGTCLALLAVIFLVFTRGKTATAMLPVVLVLAWLFEHCRPLRILITLGGIAALNVVLIGLSSSEATANFLESLGIDATFTGRSSIWAFTLQRISEQPLTGYGFQSFWGSDFLRKMTTESWAYLAAHSHNSFLEALLNGGVPGLLLVVPWLLILPLRDTGRAFAGENDVALTRLFLRIWIFSIYLACLENLFFVNSGPLWFTMLVAVFGMRLQARASLRHEEPQTASRELANIHRLLAEIRSQTAR